MFECLTLLKIEENGLQNGLKCILRDIDFHFFLGEVQPPLSYSEHYLYIVISNYYSEISLIYYILDSRPKIKRVHFFAFFRTALNVSYPVRVMSQESCQGK